MGSTGSVMDAADVLDEVFVAQAPGRTSRENPASPVPQAPAVHLRRRCPDNWRVCLDVQRRLATDSFSIKFSVLN
ncbi:hypothetical protein ACFWBX_01235 [Streptomyces sp. NPDC059991]|uniref:hypothetical protein n=1 Tax=Streptomyces sp. NPDC059991 TaxID=3347028 RepID=UPI003674E060